MPDYSYYCGNCLYRLGEDDTIDHEVEFHCKDELLEEFDDSKLYGKSWIYDIFDQLEFAENLLYIDKEKIKQSLFFSARNNFDEHLYGRRPRIAFILIDNAVELLLYGKIFLTELEGELSINEIKKAKKFIDEKIRILIERNIISKNDGNYIKFFHIIRNKFYHNLTFDKTLFIRLTNTYLVLARDLLKKIYDIIYPIIYYKENLINLDEGELIGLLLRLLKDSIKDFKSNLIHFEYIIKTYKFAISQYNNVKEWVLNTLNGYYRYDNENGLRATLYKYNPFVLGQILKSYIQLRRRSIDTPGKITNIMGEIFKNLLELTQLNNILSSSIEMYDYQIEMIMEYDR